MKQHQVNQSELRERILFDLGSQNLISLVAYPVIWTLLVVRADFIRLAPHFFWINLAILGVTTSLRLFVYGRMRKRVAGQAQFLERTLIFTVLSSATHWSTMTIWSLLAPELEPIRIATVLVVTGMAGSGTFAVAFITTLRIFFPLILLLPAGVTMLLSGNSVEWTWGALSIGFLVYVLPAAYRRQQDYIVAVSTTLLLEQRSRELEQISFTDAVTGLNNRNYFDTHLELEWRRAHRLHYPLSLLLVDLDHFKYVNDTFGHPAGDACLAAVGVFLAHNGRRAGDSVARIGGDEFAILLVNADAKAAEHIATALCQGIRDLPPVAQGQQRRVTSSIGIATQVPLTSDLADVKAFISCADGALYAAKAKGRDQWQRVPSSVRR
ncbi:GGDEF domain-containing protein [Massilia sp. TSP1-1-2]|uniref:GGDEF domain-containing protein n=1 Tax=Massilia sp. TSP1-1-2 TaxID=2804649 RepID=UPI003CE91E2B